MKENKNTNESFIGLGVLGFGIIFVLICIMYFGTDTNTQTSHNQTKVSEIKEKSEYVYYNVPTYTTIYEIVYPDSVWRYTVVHHSPSKLSSYKGTNFLYSEKHDIDSWIDRDCPKYWKKEWNKNELSVETTAPIRIVSEKVSYKKFKYKIK